MRRIAVAALACSAALGLAVTAASAAEYFSPYSPAGEIFSPGEGYGSSYDNICGRWFDNNFPKGSNAWGLITYIDTGGGWNYSKQGYGTLSRTLSSVQWTKKMHCRNNSGSTYQGGCWGYVRTYPCA